MHSLTANGARFPVPGFGTWRLRGRECRRAVESALDHGYRHVDTAVHYDNHAAVGSGIDAADVARDDVFLTTKVPGSHLRYDEVQTTVSESLDELGTDYLDLLLVHWPNDDVPIEETMGAMNDLQDAGVVEHVGVSQFSAPRLRDAMAASETPIVTNQVEYHPYYRQTSFKSESVDADEDLFDVCRRNDVLVTAYSPLGVGTVLDDETLRRIGDRYGKSPAQVLIRWHLQQGRCPIPKAASPAHQRENLDVFDFELGSDELAAIDNLSGPLRYYLFREDGPLRRARARLGAAVYRARDTLTGTTSFGGSGGES